MGFINSFLEWQAANSEKKRAKFKEQGICPDCRGRGYQAHLINAYIYMPSFEYRCDRCNATGSYSDWENYTH